MGERPLMFVCHSLGGLLVKQLLRRANDSTDPRLQQLARQTRAVLFLATPHAGAALASLANSFRVVFGATVSLEDLREHDAHLRDLFDWYRNHAPELQIETVTYYELRDVKGVLPIVNPTSSHPGVGADLVGLDEDHLSIAKPRESDAQVCGAARALLRNHVLVDSPTTVATVAPSEEPRAHPIPAMSPEVVIKLDAGTLAAREPPRVPRELPPAAHSFFGREAALQQLADRLRAGLDTAVVGPAGMGKTALAAAALANVVGANAANLAGSPFPDGLVYLDLYVFHGEADAAWNALANRLRGPEFMDRWPPRERAAEACRGRRMLVIVEGGEEADGSAGRTNASELLDVLSPECRWLLLTRVSTQAAAAETVYLEEPLAHDHAAALLGSLTARHPLDADVRRAVLELLAGHPLALNWAGNLLARDDEDPAALASEWKAGGLPALSDPRQAERTLRWLFDRSVRGVDDAERQVLAAAGLLASAPFPLASMVAAIGGTDAGDADGKRAREALKSLVQRGLLRRAGNDRWQFTHVLGYRFARDEDGSDPALRERLERWLHDDLTAALKTTASGERPAALASLLQHAAALLRADGDQRLWQPLAIHLLYELADRLEEIGRLDLVAGALSAVADWFARFSAAKAEEPFWQGQRCVLILKQGNVLRARGDLAGALTAYRESLVMRRRLTGAYPSNAGWQRALSASQNSIGDVLLSQGDLVAALSAYRESLAGIRRLTEADPSNAGWQRDLSVSHTKVGDVLLEQGDLAGTLTAYRESLAVMLRLAEADPSNAVWQRDLSVSHNKVGDVLLGQGNLAGAMAAYRESLAIRKRLAEADPSNAVWQRDLSMSHGRMGDVLRDQGDFAGALTVYHESLAIRKRLAEADPSNAIWQRDLSVSHGMVGIVLHSRGDLAGALASYREALAVFRRLAEADPSNAVLQRDLSVSLNKVGDVLRAQGDLAGALAAYRESLAVMRRLAEADPSNAVWQGDLSFILTRLAELHQRQGEDAAGLPLAQEGLAIDERLSALDPTNVTWQEDVAVSRALVARLRGGSR